MQSRSFGFKKDAEQVVKEIRLLHDPEFTDDPIAQGTLWKARKGIIASIGSMRAPGSTCINEDVAFPLHRLADAVADLQHLFVEFGYPDGAVFGHAKDGNLHFLINQAFNTDSDIAHYDRFMQAMVKVVSGKYDGALKAEHGTGRNIAPFVATEWGDEAYAIMRDLKSLFDPDHMLSPGVVINSDPKAHVTHVKSMASVAPEVDKCIECGFCELKCPSRRLTLTPRQRIVVQREISRLKSAQVAAPGGSKSIYYGELLDDFTYAGIDTCAVDGLCATACPVGINTGDFVKRLRAESIKNEKPALWIAEHFGLAEKAIGWGVRMGHVAEKVIGTTGVKSLSAAAEKLTGILSQVEQLNSFPRFDCAPQIAFVAPLSAKGIYLLPLLHLSPAWHAQTIRYQFRIPHRNLHKACCSRKHFSSNPIRCNRSLLRHALCIKRVLHSLQSHFTRDHSQIPGVVRRR